MKATEHLDTIAAISRSLIGEEPLTERLGITLGCIRCHVPFERSRVVVLGDASWSYLFPAAARTAETGDWPRRWTAQLLRTRSPLARTLGNNRQYFGWPIVWSDELFGAVEFLLPATGVGAELCAVIEPTLPLFAAALNSPASPLQMAVADEQELLEALRLQLEPPLLLQPLIQLVLTWVMRHTPAAHASLHLQRRDGDEARILTFTLPDDGAEPTTGIGRRNLEIPQANALAMARRTLSEPQPLWRRNGQGVELGLPLNVEDSAHAALVVLGPDLQRHHLELVARSAPIVAAALQRAQFYHQLVEARTHLQQVFDGMPTGLALLDSDGRLLRANPAWPRLWGLPPEAVGPGKDVPWDMFEPLLARLPAPLEFDQFFRRWGWEPRETTVSLQHPQQELHLLLVPVHDSLGLRPSYLLAVNDVTRERELDRLKTEFVSVVSHELRTPLTSILGYTELLQAREFPAHERRELIDTVWKQATHLSSLVEDLLNVSRIDAGRITLTRWVLSLSQLVKELTAQLNKALDQSRHRLLLDVSDRLPPVYADRDRLRQILGNLLSNAIKYSPEGGEIVLHAGVLRTPPASAPPLPPEPAMLTTVRDPGIGIVPEELPRIFERFYRVDNGNTRKIGGTGLGLSITQALVELHGGRIWVESVPGEGSTFYFTLPLATDVLRTQP